jgi:hypothetical protein
MEEKRLSPSLITYEVAVSSTLNTNNDIDVSIVDYKK